MKIEKYLVSRIIHINIKVFIEWTSLIRGVSCKFTVCVVGRSGEKYDPVRWTIVFHDEVGQVRP